MKNLDSSVQLGAKILMVDFCDLINDYELIILISDLFLLFSVLDRTKACLWQFGCLGSESHLAGQMMSEIKHYILFV